MSRWLIVMGVLGMCPNLYAHQWELTEARCAEIAQGIAGAQMLDGRVVHEYLEGCDYARLPALMSQAIDSMETSINEERKRRGLLPSLKGGQ